MRYIHKHAKLESNYAHMSDLRDSALKELEEAKERIAELEKQLENSVELPKDENGKYITWERMKAVCDSPSLELFPDRSGHIEHFLGTSVVEIEFDKFAAYEKKHRKPHDKHGKTIKVGDWIAYDNQRPCKVTRIYKERIATTIGTYMWLPEVSHHFGIVPEPESIEKITACEEDLPRWKYCPECGRRIEQ